jgi:hypothetical protein
MLISSAVSEKDIFLKEKIQLIDERAERIKLL